MAISHPIIARFVAPRNLLGVLIAVAALAAYAAFPFLSPAFYNSPDETANAFFAKRFAETGQLEFKEPLNAVLEERIVPRSMRAIGERVVPVGFVGVPLLYGAVARVTAPQVIPYLTPFLLALATAVLFFAVRSRSNATIATLAALVFAFHPAVWYYASRGLFPNGPFIAIVVMAFALLLWSERHTGDRPAWTQILVAMLVALALLIRTSEAPWLFLGFILLMYFLDSRRMLVRMTTIIGGFALAGLVLGGVNAQLFGSPVVFGYSKSLGTTSGSRYVVFTFWDFLVRFVRYGLLLFPVQSLLALSGAAAIVTRKELKEKYLRGVIYGSLALLVVVAFYGAIQSSDVLVSGEATIGTSYVRYWLPAFVGSVFLIVIGMLAAAERVQNKMSKHAALALLAGVYILSSFWSVWYGSSDSLSNVIASLARYESVKRDVLAVTEPNAIIITDSTDKIFFPDRRVVAGLRSHGTYQATPKFLQYAPLYYYGITLPSEDLTFLHEQLLPAGVRMTPIRTFEYETLYQFSL